MLTAIFNFVMGDVAIVPKHYPLLTLSSNITCMVGTLLGIVTIIACLIGLVPIKKRNFGF